MNLNNQVDECPWAIASWADFEEGYPPVGSMASKNQEGSGQYNLWGSGESFASVDSSDDNIPLVNKSPCVTPNQSSLSSTTTSSSLGSMMRKTPTFPCGSPRKTMRSSLMNRKASLKHLFDNVSSLLWKQEEEEDSPLPYLDATTDSDNTMGGDSIDLGNKGKRQQRRGKDSGDTVTIDKFEKFSFRSYHRRFDVYKTLKGHKREDWIVTPSSHVKKLRESMGPPAAAEEAAPPHRRSRSRSLNRNLNPNRRARRRSHHDLPKHTPTTATHRSTMTGAPIIRQGRRRSRRHHNNLNDASMHTTKTHTTNVANDGAFHDSFYR